MIKKFMTVRGEVSEENMGITLPHEHLLIDVRNWMSPLPKEASLRHLVRQSVTLENRGEVMYMGGYFEDNLFQTDINIAIAEVIKFKEAGGNTIVDMTLPNIGRDPEALFKIATNTGLNIVMGSGNYILSSMTEEDMKKNEQDIAKEIINEFENGIGYMAIKPGIIGEIGVSDIENPIEIRSLRASAIAQKKLDCGLNIHCPIWEKVNHKILDILKEAGANLNRVVMSHMDPTFDDIDFHESVAKRGVFIEYDSFGAEYMAFYGEKFLPSDGQRIDALIEMIKRGYINQMLISQDICTKICLTKWGGWGHSHILRHIIPRLKHEGLSQEQINTLIIENPKRLICS